MSVRALILSQRPFSGQLSAGAVPEPEDVLLQLAEVVAGGGIKDIETARIAAYAWYSGIDSDAVLSLFRERGVSDILRSELASHAPMTSSTASLIDWRSFERLSSHCLAKELEQPTLGWAIAVLEVAAQADFGALKEVLAPGHDPSRIATLFVATPRYVPGEERKELLSTLLRLGDPVAIEAATALFIWWITMGIEQEDMDLQGAFDAVALYPSVGASLLGSALSLRSRYDSPRLDSETLERASEVALLVDDTGQKVFANGRTINLGLNSRGGRPLDVLSAMMRWRSEGRLTVEASNALKSRAKEYLDDAFESSMRLSEGKAVQGIYVSKYSIEPLIAVLSPVGIEVHVFDSYLNGLATDSFSYMTRYALFLHDRQRAILLLFVAGSVARERSDRDLLAAVEKGATRLKLQPEGNIEVLDPSGHDEFELRCGFTIPKK
jgi:hypothetical protein